MALENKLGITESSELARMEEKLSKQRALELFETGALDRLEAGTFAALASIHRALFPISTISPVKSALSILLRAISVLLLSCIWMPLCRISSGCHSLPLTRS